MKETLLPSDNDGIRISLHSVSKKEPNTLGSFLYAQKDEIGRLCMRHFPHRLSHLRLSLLQRPSHYVTIALVLLT